ncbi:MAG: alcohol dehydrogenase catalytic domain-containing protein [Nanoarchaeota archaeon]|nr:alcohol dehydrogenase catalytic domain-containing protein [Nanoarchaeota archaeon]
MLAVLKEHPAPGVSVKEVPEPKPKEGEVLVKVKYASICGTDIGIYDWIPWAAAHIKPPTIIGHELVGEVLEVNAGQGSPSTSSGSIRPGDLVSSETHIFCGNCLTCKEGNLHVCENMKLFGIGRDGSFAEYATIPLKTTWKNDRRIPLEVMSIQEPFGNAVHAVTKAGVQGKRVLVVGLGPTGLCAGAVARFQGAHEIVGMNNSAYRRGLAEKTGWFDRVSSTSDFEDRDAYDVVLEMSGSRLGIQTAFDAVRPAGTIVAFGIPKDEISVDWGKYLINKEITILSVFGRKIWETWHTTNEMLVSGKLDFHNMITHRFPLKDFEEAMRVMKSGECGKVLLVP